MITGVSSKKTLGRAIKLRCLFLFSCLPFIFFQLHAQVLRVAIPADDCPPFYFVADDTLTGFSVETLQNIASELQLQLEWHRLPWSRVLEHVETGRADVIPLFYKTPERTARFEFSDESYFSDPIVLVCSNPCPLQFDGTLASLGNEPVAAVRRYSYGVLLDNNADMSRVDLVDSEFMLFKMLLAKRVQLVVTSVHTAAHSELLQQAPGEFEILQPALDKVEVYFAFNKQPGIAPKQRQQFNQALAEFKRGEQYQKLLSKYQLQPR